MISEEFNITPDMLRTFALLLSCNFSVFSIFINYQLPTWVSLITNRKTIPSLSITKIARNEKVMMYLNFYSFFEEVPNLSDLRVSAWISEHNFYFNHRI